MGFLTKVEEVPIGRGVIACLLLLSLQTMSGQGPEPRRPAIPVEPVGAILDAFRSHEIVTIPD